MLANLIALAITLIGAVALVVYGLRYRNRQPAWRAFPVFTGLSEEVGRSAEEGSVIHIALGNASLIGENAMTSVAALEALSALSDLAAAYDTPPIITTGDPTLYLLADDGMRRSYARLGNLRRYRRSLVQYIAADPTTYAAMTATYLYDVGIGANIILGAFDEEVSLITEAAARRGIYTMGGTPLASGLGALYPALKPKQLLMGEEFFAAGAEISQQSTYQASLGGQDLLRWLIMGSIVLIGILSILGIVGG